MIHYPDTHASYPSPPPFSNLFGSMEGDVTIFIPRGNEARYMELKYDRALAYMDSQLGAFVEHLRGKGIDRRSALVLTGDHGEEFCDHGGLYHGSGLHGEIVNVPLGFLVPSPAARGIRNDRRVASLDIMPTLLSLAGVPAPEKARGWNLVGCLEGGPLPPEHPIFTEAVVSRKHCLSALIDGGWKLIHNFYTGSDLLYRTDEDPRELNDLSVKEGARMEEMKRDLFDFKSFLQAGG
jgi:arylsulfatase A-like enzyme